MCAYVACNAEADAAQHPRRKGRLGARCPIAIRCRRGAVRGLERTVKVRDAVEPDRVRHVGHIPVAFSQESNRVLEPRSANEIGWRFSEHLAYAAEKMAAVLSDSIRQLGDTKIRVAETLMNGRPNALSEGLVGGAEPRDRSRRCRRRRGAKMSAQPPARFDEIPDTQLELADLERLYEVIVRATL